MQPYYLITSKALKALMNWWILATWPFGDLPPPPCSLLWPFGWPPSPLTGYVVSGWPLIPKKRGHFWYNIRNQVFLRESLQNRQKSSNLYKIDGFKIARICSLLNTQFFLNQCNFFIGKNPKEILKTAFIYPWYGVNIIIFEIWHKSLFTHRFMDTV